MKARRNRRIAKVIKTQVNAAKDKMTCMIYPKKAK